MNDHGKLRARRRGWLVQPTHQHWLQDEELRLIRFGRNVVSASGHAGWLDDRGAIYEPSPQLVWITARMAYVHYLAHLRGVPGAGVIADALLAAVEQSEDRVNGGWEESPTTGGAGPKTCYTHAFVLLAASAGIAAGRPHAQALLDNVSAVIRDRFTDDNGLFRDSWSADWAELDTYRGINGNMHMVEALCTAFDATGDVRWAHMARPAIDFVIERARENDWRLPEHYDADWHAQHDFNDDNRTDGFKPYGYTPGHGFEWSRLIAQASTATADAPDTLLRAAAALYERAAEDGWAPDGRSGFVYTTDWEGRPVVSNRLHWVAAEAVGAAAVLSQLEHTEVIDRQYRSWWDFIESDLIDREHGSWVHELLEGDAPPVWEGKFDLYHNYQASIIPQLRPAASVLGAVLRG